MVIEKNKAQHRNKKAHKKKDKKNNLMQTVSKQSIKKLFNHALELAYKDHIDEANKAIKQALRIARKYNIRISKLGSNYKRMYCKKCKTILIPNKTLRVRLHKTRMVYKCLKCGFIMRYPYIKEKSRKEKNKNSQD